MVGSNAISRTPSRFIAARAVKVKRPLRLKGWVFKPMGLEATGLYETQQVISPSGQVLGILNSKTIVELSDQGYFDLPHLQ